MHRMRFERIIVYLVGFLFSIALALTSYINSSFLKGYVNEYRLGFVYATAALVSIGVLFELPWFLNRWGARKTAISTTILTMVTFFTLAASLDTTTVIVAFILNIMSTSVLIANLDIFVEDFSKKHSIGEFRGLYLSLTSLAWVLTQAFSGSVLERGSFRSAYILGGLFMLLVAFIFFFFLQFYRDPKYEKTKIRHTVSLFLRQKNVRKIYWINFILKFFFAWMIIYTPLYLNSILGFSWSEIGAIFTIMLLPFVFLSYPLGVLSDRYGEKKLLAFGFLVSIVAVGAIPFIKDNIFIVWALILFLSRVGAATIEVMSESYFFKVEDERNAGAIGFFRNTQSLSYLIAPLCASLVLYLTHEFKYIFFVLAAVLLLGLFITLRLKDVK